MDNIIGIDIGFGHTKTYNSKGARCFPTAITTKVPEATYGEINPVEVNGEKFLVGDEALKESRWVIDTRTVNFLGSNAWLAPLAHALRINGYAAQDIAGGQIVMGIPPGYYTKDEARKVAIAVNTAMLKQNGQVYDLSNVGVTVIPQGAGIYYAYLAAGLGEANKNIAVVDIGHYTLDMVLFSKKKYVESATKSISMGVALLLDEICSLFHRIYGWNINHKDAQRLLRKGEITILQVVYRLEDITQKNTFMQEYLEKVASIINLYFDSLSVKPDIGIIGGGGVEILKGNIKLKHKLHIITDPLSANARGYYHYGARGGSV